MATIFPTLEWRNKGYKYVPDELKSQVIEALSFFPVLNEVEIDFRLQESIESGVMRVRPKVGSYFTTKKSYIIEISQFIKVNHRITPIQKLPSDVVVGWLGYELARIVEMLDHNVLSIYNVDKGFFQTRKASLNRERLINVHAIQSGIADKVISARDYVLKVCGVSLNDEKMRKHMSPEETLNFLKIYRQNQKGLIFSPDLSAFQTWNGWK